MNGCASSSRSGCPPDVVEALAGWQDRELGAAGGARLVPRENLHVTLAFLGSRPAGELPAILDVLERAARDAQRRASRSPAIARHARVGMLTLADEAGTAAALAGRLHGDLEELGVYRLEERAWLPHVTVLRFRERPRLRPPDSRSSRWVSSDAAAFLSRLHPSGARYEVLESISARRLIR